MHFDYSANKCKQSANNMVHSCRPLKLATPIVNLTEIYIINNYIDH